MVGLKNCWFPFAVIVIPPCSILPSPIHGLVALGLQMLLFWSRECTKGSRGGEGMDPNPVRVGEGMDPNPVRGGEGMDRNPVRGGEGIDPSPVRGPNFDHRHEWGMSRLSHHGDPRM